MNQRFVIEFAPFTVANGVSPEMLMEASDRLERDFLSTTEGYLGRVLLRKDSSSWADIVFWKSEVHASKAMESVTGSEACRSYFDCMKAADHDDPSKGVALFESFRTYGSVSI